MLDRLHTITPGRRRAAALGVATALSLAAVATAASPSGVVGAGGSVAGQGYGQWLRNSWQLALSKPASAPACQSLQTGGRTVTVLLGGYSGKREHHTCASPSSAPVYVNGLSAECSTVEKKPFHGNTAAQLRRCARSNLKGAHDLTFSVDGQPVDGYSSLVTASPVYAFHLPKHNRLGVKASSGRSAAYGDGLLLQGLAAGTHTLHVTGKVSSAPTFVYDVTYTLNVSS